MITFSHILFYGFSLQSAFRSMLHNNPLQSTTPFLHWISPLALARQTSLHFKWILKDRRHLEHIKCKAKTAYAICMRRFVFHYFVHFIIQQYSIFCILYLWRLHMYNIHSIQFHLADWKELKELEGAQQWSEGKYSMSSLFSLFFILNTYSTFQATRTK